MMKKALSILRRSSFLASLAVIIRRIWSWQPLTLRGLLAVIFGTIAVRLFALPEYDLVADILGKSILALCFLTVIFAFIFRIRIAQRLKIESRFQSDPSKTLSRHPVEAGLILDGSSVPSFFSLRAQRRFTQPGVGSPAHIVRGKAEDNGRRYLLDNLVFPHRGLWELEAVEFRLEDTLGLSRFTWEAPLTSSIEVSAETIPIQPLPVVASSARAGDELSQSRERAGDLFDIKAYDPSDGTKRILWKTYAKSGQLVVRRPEPAVIPEGELALYLVARPDEDFVAGALQDYLRQLDQSSITVLFGTDGMDDPRAEIKSGFLTEAAEIQHAVNRCVWSPDCGSGRGFGAYLGALQSADRVVRQIVVFGSEQGEWLTELSNLASLNLIKLTIAMVPDAVDPEVSARELRRRRTLSGLPKLAQSLPGPVRRAASVFVPAFRDSKPMISAAKYRSIAATSNELIIVQSQNVIG